MNTDKYDQIKDIFMSHNGYASTKEVSTYAINRYYISELSEKGIIEKVKNGFYKWCDYDFDFDFELVEVSRIVPTGVLCLKSALAYHNLTTYNPWQYEVAIERSDRVAIPPYPPIKIVFFSKALYELGISEIDIAGHKVRIYDMEKTICDCIRYRNKIGIDMIKECLHEYLKRNDRNLTKLMSYAETCRIKKILKEYLEVLV